MYINTAVLVLCFSLAGSIAELGDVYYYCAPDPEDTVYTMTSQFRAHARAARATAWH